MTRTANAITTAESLDAARHTVGDMRDKAATLNQAMTCLSAALAERDEVAASRYRRQMAVALTLFEPAVETAQQAVDRAKTARNQEPPPPTPIGDLLEVDRLARIAHEAFRAWFVAEYPEHPRRAVSSTSIRSNADCMAARASVRERSWSTWRAAWANNWPWTRRTCAR